MRTWLRSKLFGQTDKKEEIVAKITQAAEGLDGAVRNLEHEVTQVKRTRDSMTILLDDALNVMKKEGRK